MNYLFKRAQNAVHAYLVDYDILFHPVLNPVELVNLSYILGKIVISSTCNVPDAVQNCRCLHGANTRRPR